MKQFSKLTFLIALVLGFAYLVKYNRFQGKDHVSEKSQEKGTQQSRQIASTPNVLSSKDKTSTPTPLIVQEPKKKVGPFFPRSSQKRFKGLKAINQPHPDWKERMQKGILRFGLEAEKFKVDHIDSVIRKEGKKVRNLEWVKISYFQKGFPRSYDALVDSQSGRVTQTWNHIKYEPMFNRNRQLSFTLKGLLKNDE